MLNRAVARLTLLCLFLPWISMAATPPPPVVRSLLTTNIVAAGVPGLVLGRILAPPYIDWVAGVPGGDAVLSNAYWAAWGSLSSNAITGKLDSNVWWAGWGMLGTNALTPKLDSNSWYTAWGSLSTNSITDKLDSNVWAASWGALSTNSLTGKLDSNTYWAQWGSIGTNSLSDKLDSNWWWTAYGSKVITNAGQFIISLNGQGTNTTFNSSAATSVPLVVSNSIGSDTNSFEVSGTNGITGKSVVVSSDGKVGIGTNIPQALLHVRGTNGPSQLIVQVENPMVVNQTNLFSVTTNGAVGIAKIPALATFDVGGSIASSTTIKASSSSGIGFTSSSLIRAPSDGYITISGTSLTNAFGILFGTNSISGTNVPAFLTFGTGYSNTPIPTIRVVSQGGSGPANMEVSGSIVSGTNIVQKGNVSFPKLLVIGDSSGSDYVSQFGTTNKSKLWTVDTNGNSMTAGTFTATNGLAYVVSNSFIEDLVIVTNNPQIYCVNGTNQLITLPDCTKISVGQIIRFSSTNGYSSFVLTNATGSQTIRDGTSLNYKSSGVSSVAFFNDGSAWWIASKAKTIWPNASWSTSTNVPFAVATSNYVTFDQLESSNAQGISLTNGYQIYIRDAGQYMLTYSIVTQVGHNNDTNRVWLQQSAQNVPRTRTDVKLTSTSEQVVMTVNYIVPVVTNLTWFALVLRSTDTGAQLVTGAAASAIMPAMPSAIVTVNKISDTFP